MQNKRLIILAVILTGIISGLSLIGYLNQDKAPQVDNLSAKLIVTTLGYNQTTDYAGEEITALDLLEKYHDVNTTISLKYGAFINCINNICSTKDYYWMYYVNGKLAPVGAAEYFVKDNDILEFIYEKPAY